MGKFFDWLDHRTGYRKLRDAMLLEHIPGGAKWRYVWGSALAFVFFIQLVTGILLMTAYVPGDEDAWGSVYFIQYEMDFGWLIRGLHHFGSQTMVVLMGLHMLQVVIAGAHLPPREINWWLGLALMGIVLGLSLTGYLLPWDQKGYYATQVATNILAGVPLIGPFLQRVLVGGPEYGHQTLTHFFALHVGILPPLLIVFLILHIAVFRRHGITTRKDAKGEGLFWPDQAFRDLVVCLIIFGIMLSLVVFVGHGHKIETPGAEAPSGYDYWAKAGRDGRGANLDAPADRATEGYPARPEWYFLFLFQLLKYFEGDREIIGTVIIPGAVGLVLFLVPLMGYGRMRKFGHAFGIIVVVGLLAAVAALTVLALADDAAEPWAFGLGGSDKAKDFQKRLKAAELEAKIAVQSASEGIPSEGARFLVRGNPLITGKKLFKTHCASCHAYDFGESADAGAKDKASTPQAADLTGFGTEKWIRGLLENPADKKYFGHTPRLGGMIEWREGLDESISGIEEKDKQEARRAETGRDLDEIAWWLAQQAVDADDRKELLKDAAYSRRFGRGKELFKTYDCATCHRIEDDPLKRRAAGAGPNLTGYGSQEWVHGMILDPWHPTRYGGTMKLDTKDEKGMRKREVVLRNTMTAFRPAPESGPARIALNAFREELDRYVDASLPEDVQKKHLAELHGKLSYLSDYDRELIVRFLTGDRRVVFGGQPISGPPRNKK